MTKHPQLNAFLEKLKQHQNNKQVSYQYADKHTATLSKVKGTVLVLESTNPVLIGSFYSMLDRLLRGEMPSQG